MLAHWHVAHVGRERVVFAAVEYPEASPPETICIGGITYARQKDERPTRRGERIWTEETPPESRRR